MNRFRITGTCLIAGGLFISTNLPAMDLGEGLANESDSVLLKNHNNKYVLWNGIGKIFLNDIPSCNASLLDTRDTNNVATGPAYVLTTAECAIRYVAPGSTAPKETVKFNYFNDTLDTATHYSVKRKVWDDYVDRDLAILELDASLDALIKNGITPLKLESESSGPSSDILIVGAPENGLEPGLRLAACTQEALSGTLVEYPRNTLDTFKNRCKDSGARAAGSPVLDRKSGHMLSVVSADSGGSTIDEQCFPGAPCEATNGQPSWILDTNYSQSATNLSSCFNGGIFSPAGSSCAPVTYQLADYKQTPTAYIAMSNKKSSPPPVIEAKFSLNTNYYRFKTVRDPKQCHSPADYSDIHAATNVNLSAPLKKELGIHVLCVIGVNTAKQELSTELMRSVWKSTTVVAKIARPPLPELNITHDKNFNYTFSGEYLLPTRARTLYYTGPIDTDCSSIEREQFSTTLDPVTIKSEQLPLILCSQNMNLYGYTSKVRSDLLKRP